jgi:hypothetical protein
MRQELVAWRYLTAVRRAARRPGERHRQPQQVDYRGGVATDLSEVS